jgi:FkbM family methyltransferase
MSIAQRLVSLAKPLVERFPRMAALYRRVRDQLDEGEPKPTPWGFLLAGNKAMIQGTYEPMETELVRKILKEVDVLVNVGANVGYYCCHALSMGKTVIAFEPMPRNLRYLCRNIKANGWSDVDIFPLALSNRAGVLEIYGGNTGASVVKGWSGTPENYVSLVPSSTLDLVLGNRLQGKRVFILVDVEGAEKWMLEGATTLLAANDPKPIWIVEITTRDHQPRGSAMNPTFKSTFELFFSHGYEAFNADREMTPMTLKQVDLALSGKLRLATHNFLFRGPRTTP